MKKLFFIFSVFLTSCKNTAFFKQFEKTTISVRIEGEVIKPGIYEISLATKLNEVIKLAGGISENADTDSIAYDMILKDNDIITIPSKANQKINLNSATIKQLQLIPGIGKVMANKIIDYRNQNGIFKSYDGLLEIKGMNEKKFNKILPYLKLR